MTALAGTWQLTLRTPIGTMTVTVRLQVDDGMLTGVAAGSHEQVPLRAIHTEATPHGERVTWSQSITRPMRLNLDFDVIVIGDRMEGHSRAGRLPRTTVNGVRIAAP